VQSEPINPCQPSPCGPNAQCQNIGGSPSCSCLQNMIGTPPNCRPECINNAECPSNQACINQKCRDPCPGSCGANTECRVVSHTPVCICLAGYTGDPFTQCSILQREPVYETSTPCNPNPCGSNAQCREQNGAGACTCTADYIGNPYEGCRPECVLNSDCPSNKACIRNKCQDPCPGTCGQNADCQVVNHLPSCTCYQGYTGDPFRLCRIESRERKKYFYSYCYLNLFCLPKNILLTFQKFAILFGINLNAEFFNSCSTRICESMPTFTLWSKQSMSRSKWTSGLFMLANLYWQPSRL
jgi:hypothetical protein